MPTNTFFATISSSVDEISKEAGFQSNENISQSELKRYQRRAFTEIWSVVIGIYNVETFTTARFSGSLAEQFLRDVEVLLGAGYLLHKQYGINALAATTADEAVDKIAEAKNKLEDISNGTIKLVDVDNVEFTRETGEQAGGPVSSPKTSDKIFSVCDKY